MVDNIKTGIGFFIPVASLIGFVLSILSNNYFASIIFIVSGMMIWMLYILVVESNTPALMGNILILFVVLLSLAVFLNYGLSQNMFGGYELKADGSLIALLVLFFGGLIGMIFRQSISDSPAPSAPERTNQTNDPSAIVFFNSWLLGGIIIFVMGALLIQFIASKLRPISQKEEGLQTWEDPDLWYDDYDRR